MTFRPLVSIISPSFNKGEFIEECIESIQRQSYPNWEHIVVDGGSNDQTIQILRRYSHIRWISEPDGGMYNAINKGIGLARGDIIAYLNCDDRYFPSTLRRVVKEFATSEIIDFVYGYCGYIDKSGAELFFMRSIPYFPFLLKKMPRIPWAQPSTFWRRAVHDKIGTFDEQFMIVGDFEFFGRMIRRGCRGKLVRAKLSQFMLDNSFAEQDKYLIERKRAVDVLGCGASTTAKVRGALAEVLFKLSNVDNYVRRAQMRRKK